jgi:hypothetical protein
VKFYTYLHYKMDDKVIFYVGKGQNRRAFDTACRNNFWNNTVNKHGFGVQILAYWETEKEAFDHEKLLISCFKEDMNLKLCNLTNGGEGVSGFKRSASSNLLVSKHSRSGHPDVRALISKQVNLSQLRPEVVEKLKSRVFKPLSFETRVKMSTSHKKRLTPEVLKTLLEMNKKAGTVESRFKMSQASKGKPKPKIECPFCFKLGAANVMKRWHFEKCKVKL